MKSDDCKLADHEEGRGGSLCPRSLAQLTDIPFFLSMDEETSDATIQSESPGPRRLPVPPAPWHPLIDYWLVVYREKIAISMLWLDILAGQGEGSSELSVCYEK